MNIKSLDDAFKYGSLLKKVSELRSYYDYYQQSEHKNQIDLYSVWSIETRRNQYFLKDGIYIFFGCLDKDLMFLNWQKNEANIAPYDAIIEQLTYPDFKNLYLNKNIQKFPIPIEKEQSILEYLKSYFF